MTARGTEDIAERGKPCTVVHEGRSLAFKFASTMDHVETVVAEVRAFFEQRGATLAVGCVTILRELLINAVEHGNKRRPEAFVEGSVLLLDSPGLVRFTVRDEGEGFDHSKLTMGFPEDPCALRGRGFALMRSFAERIEFNAKGNEVTVCARNGEETPCTIREEQGWTIVAPYGNITAAVTGRFCDTLTQVAERGNGHVRLDLAHVRDIDSTGLTAFLMLPRLVQARGHAANLEAVNVGPDVMQLLRLTRLDAVYRIRGADSAGA